MFLRWQSRKRDRYGPAFGQYSRTKDGRVLRADTKRPDIRWSAIIAECVRVDGKPTQRHVAYLVGFTESQAQIEAQRCRLWNGIDERLDALSNRVKPEDRRKIEAAIAKKLRRPSRRDQLRVARHTLENWSADGLSDKQRALLGDEVNNADEGKAISRMKELFG